jgi:hypothetical protein
MSRVVFLALDEGVVVIRCLSEEVGISAIERLPGGGVRLVCNSGHGAALIRRKLKAYVMDEEPKRVGNRPFTPSAYDVPMRLRSHRSSR